MQNFFFKLIKRQKRVLNSLVEMDKRIYRLDILTYLYTSFFTRHLLCLFFSFVQTSIAWYRAAHNLGVLTEMIYYIEPPTGNREYKYGNVGPNPFGSTTLAKVKWTFGCSRYTILQSRSVKMGSVDNHKVQRYICKLRTLATILCWVR